MGSREAEELLAGGLGTALGQRVAEAALVEVRGVLNPSFFSEVEARGAQPSEMEKQQWNG